MSTRRFACTGAKGVYVVEYTTADEPYLVWIKWGRGFWELRLKGRITPFQSTYTEPNGQHYFEPDGNVPQVDLDLLARGVRARWHKAPPSDFDTFRFES